MPEPTVYVVEDDEGLRKSLVWLIESVGLPVRAFASAREFLDASEEDPPGCLVADLRMPGLSGLDLQEALRERRSCLPLILISAHAEVPTAVRAMKAGALDVIEKPFSDQLLLDRVREALALNRERRDDREERDEIERRFERLTARERQVLRAIVAGHANKVIAADLAISPKTVEVHRARIMEKMEVDSVAHLVRAWLRLGGDGDPSRR